MQVINNYSSNYGEGVVDLIYDVLLIIKNFLNY